MPFTISSSVVVVDTSPAPLFSFLPRNLASVVIKAVGQLNIGSSGVTTTNSVTIQEGQTLSIKHSDFTDDMLKENALVTIMAVAPSQTTAELLYITRR